MNIENGKSAKSAIILPDKDRMPPKPQQKRIKDLSKAEIHDLFIQWVSEPIPEQIHGMSDEHEYLIADVFVISRETDVYDPGIERNAREEMTYPIAKVLQCGKFFGLDKEGKPRKSYAAGSLVRLKDLETMTIENPRYEIATQNQYTKSNLKQEGTTPPKWWQKLWDTHARRMFALDPFERDMMNWKNSIFLFDTPNIVGPITDWKKLITP